jgi:hypothetical protein
MFSEVWGIQHQFKLGEMCFMVFSSIILGFIISKEGKLLDIKNI